MTLNDIRNEGMTFWNGVSLATDVASLILPVVPAGASHVIRASKLRAKAINAADTVADAAKLATHADDFADAARIVDRSLPGLKRFVEADTKILPDVLKAFGGGISNASAIPDAFKGRRVTTLESFADTTKAAEDGSRILNLPGKLWSPQTNWEWIQEAIQNGDVFDLVTSVDSISLSSSSASSKGISVYARELDALLQAGYQRVENYLIPPK